MLYKAKSEIDLPNGKKVPVGDEFEFDGDITPIADKVELIGGKPKAKNAEKK